VPSVTARFLLRYISGRSAFFRVQPCSARSSETHSGIKSSQLSMMNTRRTYSRMLLSLRRWSNSSKGAVAHRNARGVWCRQHVCIRSWCHAHMIRKRCNMCLSVPNVMLKWWGRGSAKHLKSCFTLMWQAFLFPVCTCFSLRWWNIKHMCARKWKKCVDAHMGSSYFLLQEAPMTLMLACILVQLCTNATLY